MNMMKSNLESPHSALENNEAEKNAELREALNSLSNNNDISRLTIFISKHGIQETPLTLSTQAKRHVQLIVEYALERAEKKSEYNNLPINLGLLKNAGALTEDMLSNEINNYIEQKMMFTPDQAAAIKDRIGMSVTLYDSKNVADFIEKVRSGIANSLDWNIEINDSKS